MRLCPHTPSMYGNTVWEHNVLVSKYIYVRKYCLGHTYMYSFDIVQSFVALDIYVQDIV